MINLKKFICIFFSFVFALSLFNFSVFATEVKTETISDYILSNEVVIEEAEGIYNTNNGARATGLISQKTLTLSKTSNPYAVSLYSNVKVGDTYYLSVKPAWNQVDSDLLTAKINVG